MPPGLGPFAAVDAGDMPHVEYASYESGKWGFSVDYPTFMTKKPVEKDGQGWIWRGNTLYMRAWGAHYPNSTVKELYDDWTRGRHLTFREQKDNYWIVAGKEDGNLFWSKSILQDKLLVTVQFEYKPAMKDWFEPIIAHIVGSLKLLPGVGFRK